MRDVDSLSSVTCASKTLAGDHFGCQSSVFGNHESINCNYSIDMPLVRRSAGFSVNGVNDHLSEGNCSIIPLIYD